MEEIKVGDFIRTNDGQIGKLIRIERDDIDTSLKWHVFNDAKNERYVNKPYITKYSKNIIDLIEIGDYVNGYRIDNIINGVLVNNAVGLDRSGVLTPIVQYEKDIKTILTKEQYMQNCFKLD